jgi:hypothetical protein
MTLDQVRPVRPQLCMYTSMPALAHAQNVQASRSGVSTVSKEITMTQLAPAPPGAAKDTARCGTGRWGAAR